MAGMGGSAGSSSSSTLQEHKRHFSWQTLKVVKAGSAYMVIDNRGQKLVVAPNKKEANRALKVMRFYKMDGIGHVGTSNSSMTYYLSRNRAPVGRMQGEDAIKFDLAKLRVSKIHNKWYIVEGTSSLLYFGNHKAEAFKALKIIKKYKFTYQCYIGRPNASMTYFRR